LCHIPTKTWWQFPIRIEHHRCASFQQSICPRLSLIRESNQPINVFQERFGSVKQVGTSWTEADPDEPRHGVNRARMKFVPRIGLKR